MFEALEKRRLLAGQVLNAGPSGVLEIDGTAGDDTIVITNATSVIHVDYGGGVTEDWDPGTMEFHSIVVNAGGGNDVVDSTALLNASGITGISMNGEAGDDTLQGGEGDDTMDGGAGADLMVGNDGNDTVTYASRTAAVSVTIDGAANDGESGENDNVDVTVDTIVGGSGNDTISAAGVGVGREFDGGAGDDSLVGSDGPDTLSGNDGNDTLDGGQGGDLMFGGLGNDTVTYASRTASVTVTIDGNADDGESGESDYVDPSIETIIGGHGGDNISAAGVSTGVNIQGGAGANTITGGDGNDTLTGGDNADTIDGGAGADFIHGSSGNDSIVGGTENDTIFGDGGNDCIAGGTGNDEIHGGLGNDNLSGDDGNDTLFGDSDNDTLLGAAGNDSLVGGADNDSMLGGDGNDSLSGNQGSDVFSGGNGADWADYSYSTLGIVVSIDGVANDGAGKTKTSNIQTDIENILGGTGADRMIGSGKGNLLIGGAGNDTLSGGNSGDSLVGGDGDDCLVGNNGPDTIQGGDGNDRMFSSYANKHNDGVTDIVDGGLGTDTLTRDGSDTVLNVETLL